MWAAVKRNWASLAEKSFISIATVGVTWAVLTLPAKVIEPLAVEPTKATTFYYKSPSTPGVIVIDDDPGGYIQDHARWVNRVRESGVPVRVRGLCVSACTLLLSLPTSQVCVEPTASFGFHMASLEGEADPQETVAMIHRWYPPVVQAWLKGKALALKRIIYMSAEEAIKIKLFSACGDN